MGNYNSHSPYILGEEWVPIRQANYTADTTTEHGYRFATDHAFTPITGSFNVAQPGQFNNVNYFNFMSLYTADTEDLTGPIKKLRIPVSAAVVTGADGFTAVGGTLVQCLALAGDGKYVQMALPAAPPTRMGVSFDVTTYQSELQGKRILDMNLLYELSGNQSGLNDTLFSLDRLYSIGTGGASYSNANYPMDSEGLRRTPMGWGNPFWNTPGLANSTNHMFPWRWEEMTYMTTTAGAQRLVMTVINFKSGNDAFGILDYLALEVTYCEERRLKYGGNASGTIVLGTNYTPLRNPTDLSVTGSLAAGSYVVTHSWGSAGVTPYYPPVIDALRELYEVYPQQGRIVTKSTTVDATFTAVSGNVLPHIAVHHSGGVVTGCHAYGTQIQAPVYGTITATQEIEDDPVSVSTAFPQVRFYARRFGDTTVALTLTDVATGTKTVSISVADFDALPVIVDGWKAVTLRFASPPSFVAGAGDIDWRWSATSETAANQWQILGANGPTVTGTQSVDPATYYSPVGNTVDLTWKSANVTVPTEDTGADAVLIFSQDPPTITGFSVTGASFPITGISSECGGLNCCIPTGIAYNRVTWSAQTALPVTGFGNYELQRSDTVSTDWTTIMKATSPYITGFSDYEARVGISSSYRIRINNVLDFGGPYATGAAFTVPTPGVYGGCRVSSGVLILTSNERPGSSLAYVEQFTGSAQEDFKFPEADQLTLQLMYGKDYPTAFRPSERGGEQFSRTILVHRAAISPPSLADFRELRDLAWADLSYVCVRDELGNRWFAAIRVPDGKVSNNRRIYLAQLDIIEVSTTPSVVIPASS